MINSVIIRSVIAIVVLLPACARSSARPGPPASPPPAFMLGEFQDDYGERHSISADEWGQQPRNRFHIVRWVPEGRYLIARNDSSNSAGGGKWTRIDWVLVDSPPYTWAFCFSAYEAPSRAIAESVSVARPDTPRAGCNGHPYTRMRVFTAP